MDKTVSFIRPKGLAEMRKAQPEQQIELAGGGGEGPHRVHVARQRVLGERLVELWMATASAASGPFGTTRRSWKRVSS